MTPVILGNACLDETHRLGRLPRPGETINALAVSEDLGGKGLNQAIAARRAGADVRFLAVVGDDAVGEAVRRRLEKEAIPADGLLIRPGRSDRSLILLDGNGENIIVTCAMQAEGLRFAELQPRLALAAGDMLVLQGNLSDDTTRSAAAAARLSGALVVFNPALFRPAHVDLADRVDVLVLNAGELAAFAGDGDPAVSVARIAVPLVIVTLGSNGCMLAERGLPVQHLPAPPARAVDTVGAGDTFVGVFAAEFHARHDAVRAARLGIAAASEKVSRPGSVSALPTRDDIHRLRRSLFDGSRQ